MSEIDYSKITYEDVQKIRVVEGNMKADEILRGYHEWLRQQRLKDKENLGIKE